MRLGQVNLNREDVPAYLQHRPRYSLVEKSCCPFPAAQDVLGFGLQIKQKGNLEEVTRERVVSPWVLPYKGIAPLPT